LGSLFGMVAKLRSLVPYRDLMVAIKRNHSKIMDSSLIAVKSGLFKNSLWAV